MKEVRKLGASNFFLPYFPRDWKIKKLLNFSDSEFSDLGIEQV